MSMVYAVRVSTKCTCLKCAPRPGMKFHPKWGYDLDKVRGVHCLRCGEPIGEEPYVEDMLLARFGQMCFRHKRCDDEVKRG